MGVGGWGRGGVSVGIIHESQVEARMRELDEGHAEHGSCFI